MLNTTHRTDNRDTQYEHLPFKVTVHLWGPMAEAPGLGYTKEAVAPGLLLTPAERS